MKKIRRDKSPMESSGSSAIAREIWRSTKKKQRQSEGPRAK